MTSEIKHIVFLRNAPPVLAWGGLEKLLMEWFERIDYSQCKVTLVMPLKWLELFKKRLVAKNIPINLVEWPDKWDTGSSWERLAGLFRLLRTLRPSSVVFIQGW